MFENKFYDLLYSALVWMQKHAAATRRNDHEVRVRTLQHLIEDAIWETSVFVVRFSFRFACTCTFTFAMRKENISRRARELRAECTLCLPFSTEIVCTLTYAVALRQCTLHKLLLHTDTDTDDSNSKMKHIQLTRIVAARWNDDDGGGSDGKQNKKNVVWSSR